MTTQDWVQAAQRLEQIAGDNIPLVGKIATFLRKGWYDYAQHIYTQQADKLDNNLQVRLALRDIFGCLLHGRHNCQVCDQHAYDLHEARRRIRMGT